MKKRLLKVVTLMVAVIKLIGLIPAMSCEAEELPTDFKNAVQEAIANHQTNVYVDEYNVPYEEAVAYVKTVITNNPCVKRIKTYQGLNMVRVLVDVGNGITYTDYNIIPTAFSFIIYYDTNMGRHLHYRDYYYLDGDTELTYPVVTSTN